MLDRTEWLATQSHIYLPDLGPPQFILQLEDQAFYLTRRLLHVIYTSSSYAGAGFLNFVGDDWKSARRILSPHHSYHMGGT